VVAGGAESVDRRGDPERRAALVAHAKAYPFNVPDFDYVYAGGTAYRLSRDAALGEGGAAPDWTSCLAFGGAAAAPSRLQDVIGEAAFAALAHGPPRRAVIACGSNAAPARLARKFVDRPNAVIPTLRILLKDYAVVYSAKICSYGSAPATLYRAPGAAARIFVNLMTEDELAHMDASELLGFEYDRPPLEAPEIAAALGVDEITGYVSKFGALAAAGRPLALDAVPGAGPGLARAGQAHALAHMQACLDVSGPLDDFIYENIVDAAARLRRNERLRDAFSLSSF